MARVLIVDDHAGYRRVARRLLQAEGLEVVGEASASALAARLRPDVVRPASPTQQAPLIHPQAHVGGAKFRFSV